MKKFLIKTSEKIKNTHFFKHIIVNLIIISFVSIVNPTKAQALTSTVTIQLENARLSDFFSEVEKKTDYVFFYKTDVDISENVSVNAENESLKAVLDKTFGSLNLKYRIKGHQITVVADKKAEKVMAPEPQPVRQQTDGKLTGRVIDKNGEALPGVTITVTGSTRGVLSDENGNFEIGNVAIGTKLTASFIGMQNREFTFEGKPDIIVVMEENVNELDEVTVVAFGRQKKESIVSSITSVDTKDLHISSSNLTAAFAGRIPGLISYQTTGEPGRDNAQFFVRGVTTFGYKSDPLILIDGFEASTEDLARLQPDDIEAFSILKDASATVLYGARGANGIITIQTKSGREGDKVKISARFDVNVSTPTSMLELLDGVSYMRLYNDARLSRHNDAMLQYEEPEDITPMAAWYSEEKIQATLRGDNPMVYPNINWYDMLMKNYTTNSKANINISGGGLVATYYVALGYERETGLLKVDNQDDLNNFNSNIGINRVNFRSNVTFKIGKTTSLDTRISGRLTKYNGPATSASDIFKMVMDINPVEFPTVWEPDAKHINTRWTMFGQTDPAKTNPFAQMVRGYTQSNDNNVTVQATLAQDLDMILPNLKFQLKASVNTSGTSSQTRIYNPVYYALESVDELTGEYTLYNTNPGTTPYLGDVAGGRNGDTHFYYEGRFNWNNTFGPHNVSFMTVGVAEEKILTNGENGSIYETLPERNLGNSSRFTYDYDSRYFLEASYGYNGSEKFDKKHRFGFFPAIGLAWIASNESFYGEGLKDVIDMMKLKFTWGKVGNDAIAGRSGRFYFLSDISNGGGWYFWGKDALNFYEGYTVRRYNNPNISWEVSTKYNLGVELGLLKGMTIQADLFKDTRDKIYWGRNNIPETMGYETAISGNVGKVESKGFDGSMDYKHSFNPKFWMAGRANLTYAVNKVLRTDEPAYKEDYLYQVGQAINQSWGYIAERLFVDQEEIDNSPSQIAFGEYMRGDIKYLDVNKDGVINSNDRVPIGFPTVPQVQYGFGLSTGYKDFDISFFFQGNARVSFYIAPGDIAPLVDRRNAPAIVARDSWTETNPDVHAFWPRLATYHINNNLQQSTWWLRDGSFMRLKTVECGFAPKFFDKIGLKGTRIYLSGENLFYISSFKMWDPEMGGNGLSYPINRRFNVGLQIML
jgi:TonB-linked SusC/RagA family outer membrane protein